MCFVLASTVSYYLATQIAWALTFPDSKVSLFFPPQAVLLCILLLVPSRGRPRALSLRRLLEAALVGACTVALGIFVFDATPAGPNTSPALLYTPIPLLIWAALRFGLGGISVSMLLITVQAIWGTMRGHGPFLAQTPVQNALELQLFLLVTATPLMLLAVVIEEERRSKEALRESANLMGLAAEAGNLAMWVWDVSGNDVWMTERGRSLFGLEPGARLDFAATFDRVHPEDRTARESAITQAVQGRGEYDMEYRVQRADGMTRWIHGRGRYVAPEDGSSPKLFGVSTDVTARKQAEASAAQKRAELEHVARVATLGELTTTLTHELRQPFAAILAHTYIGERLLDAPEPDLQEVRNTLSDICKVTEHAGDVIGGLSAMLKRDSTTPGLTHVDLNTVIRVVERIVYGDAMLHKVTVHLDLSSDVRPVKGDSVQLQQVILNLMLNAFSAMSGTGLDGARRLVVRTNSSDTSTVLVEVQDSGTGIAAERLESIFDPFVTSKPDGLGMGLSICRSIIERHGGTISAANNPDRGATFSITLPVTRE